MSGPPPSDPTSSLPPTTDRSDAPPPVREPSEPGEGDRCFEVAGKRWIARLQGKGACGTGAYGLALVEAVHFYEAELPDRPVCEVVLARGRFAGLFDSELAELLAQAIPIVLPEEH